MKRKITLDVTFGTWTCGDGCCSEPSTSYTAYENGGAIAEDSDLHFYEDDLPRIKEMVLGYIDEEEENVEWKII